MVTPRRLCAIEYGGWIDSTYVHVIPRGHAGANVNVHVRTLEELDGMVYHMQVKSTDSRCGVPDGVPQVSRDDV